MKACYEKELEQSPKLEGRVMVEFVVATTGTVKSAKLQPKGSTLNNATVESCIFEAIKKWEFPKPTKGEVTVTYPFVLKAVGE